MSHAPAAQVTCRLRPPRPMARRGPPPGFAREPERAAVRTGTENDHLAAFVADGRRDLIVIERRALREMKAERIPQPGRVVVYLGRYHQVNSDAAESTA